MVVIIHVCPTSYARAATTSYRSTSVQKLLALESSDLSQAEKKATAVKPEQLQKMKTFSFKI